MKRSTTESTRRRSSLSMTLVLLWREAAGEAPEGVFQIGQDLFVDTQGELAPKKRGAVVTAIGHAIEDATVLAPSLAAFLAAAR